MAAEPHTPLDPVDAIMTIMNDAFDPAYGEAWNNRQVSDALMLGNCHYQICDAAGQMPASPEETAGFTLSRQAADEEELLLIAVKTTCRRAGIASILMKQLTAAARARGVSRIFLEMREGNPAEEFYRKHGFLPVGRRKNYYNRGTMTGIDAITFTYAI